MDKAAFASKLLAWWRVHGRDYPWRRTRNPYTIFVSEVLLHRTRAEQVLPVYRAILKRYPTLSRLADADETEVEAVARPLGLFWRGKLIVEAAIQMQATHGGTIPEDIGELKSLPGVGNYISSAISCFALGKPEVLLDTNTVRVLGRVFGEEVTDGARRSKKFHRLGSLLLDRDHPREFNYALIDLGALVCRPTNPDCDSCPVQPHCKYGTSERRT